MELVDSSVQPVPSREKYVQSVDEAVQSWALSKSSLDRQIIQTTTHRMTKKVNHLHWTAQDLHYTRIVENGYFKEQLRLTLKNCQHLCSTSLLTKKCPWLSVVAWVGGSTQIQTKPYLSSTLMNLSPPSNWPVQ